MNTILDVKNLSVSYDGHRILEEVSFSAERGEVFGLLGPNGAGKTTLFRALLNLIPYDGQVIWHGEARIGYVPQRLDFDKTLPLTVEELLLLRDVDPAQAGNNGEFWFPPASRLQAVQNALMHVQAGRIASRRLGELSGGELQRVLIAYAILGRPSVLLFDEPTSGIDLAGETTIYNLIRHLAQGLKMTIFLISHDVSILYAHVDHVFCLNRRLVCSGPPRDVLTDTQLRKLYGSDIKFYKHDHEH